MKEDILQRAVYLALWAFISSTSSMAIAQQSGNPFESVGKQDEREAVIKQHKGEITLPSIAQEDATSQIVDGFGFTIGAVSVKTAPKIPAVKLARSYEKFIGQNADGHILQELASAVTDVARREGYIFASAQIPQQAVKTGVVTVELDLGTIDEVRISGSGNKQLREILDKLLKVEAISTNVERQLLLAADLPDIILETSTYIRENGNGILFVNVREDKSTGYVSLDNYGPETLGPVRATMQTNLTGLLFEGDVFTTNVINTIAQPNELTYVNARYAQTLNGGQTVIGLSAASGRTHAGGYLEMIDLEGRNKYASFFATHALKRSMDLNLWLNGEFSYLEVEQNQNGVIFQKDQVVTASVNFSGSKDLGIGRIYGGIGVTQGLGILGANRDGDNLNSRLNGSGEFTKVNSWVNTVLNFGDGFGARLSGSAQITSRPLLSVNELALGGPSFGRGYEFSERFGDEGVMGSAEFRKEFKNMSSWLQWAQFYGFIDGGHVSNIGDGLGSGSLASAGGGVRAQIGSLDFGLEAAAPVNTDRFETGNRSPRVNVQLGMRF